VRRKASPESFDSPDDHRIDTAEMDETLGLLTPDEIGAVARFIEACELVDHMSPDEAATWRCRLMVWRKFLEIDDAAEPNG